MIIRMQDKAFLQIGGDRAAEEFVRLARHGLTPPKLPKRGEIETYSFQWGPVVDVEGVPMSVCNSIRGMSLSVMKGKESKLLWAYVVGNDVDQYLGTHETMELAQKIAEDFASKNFPILAPNP